MYALRDKASGTVFYEGEIDTEQEARELAGDDLEPVKTEIHVYEAYVRNGEEKWREHITACDTEEEAQGVSLSMYEGSPEKYGTGHPLTIKTEKIVKPLK